MGLFGGRQEAPAAPTPEERAYQDGLDQNRNLSFDQLNERYNALHPEEELTAAGTPTDVVERVARQREQQVGRGRDRALDRLMGQRVLEKCRQGREPLNENEKEFLLRDLARNGLGSARAEQIAQERGFRNLQDMLNKIDCRDEYLNKANPERAQLLQQVLNQSQQPQGFLSRMPRFWRNRVGDVAKGGVATLATVGILGLFGAPIMWPAVLGAYAGGVIGKGIASYITREKRIYGAREGDTSLAYKTVDEVIDRILYEQQVAQEYRGHVAEAGENITPEQEMALRGYALNSIVQHGREQQMVNFNRYRQLDKSATKWELFGQIGGAVLGGMAGKIGADLYSAYTEGVRMRGAEVISMNSQEGHVVKHAHGGWHHVLDQGVGAENRDLVLAQANYNEGMFGNTSWSEFFHAFGRDGGHVEITRDLVARAAANNQELLHIADHASPIWQVLTNAAGDGLGRGLLWGAAAAAIDIPGRLANRTDGQMANNTRDGVIGLYNAQYGQRPAGEAAGGAGGGTGEAGGTGLQTPDATPLATPDTAGGGGTEVVPPTEDAEAQERRRLIERFHEEFRSGTVWEHEFRDERTREDGTPVGHPDNIFRETLVVRETPVGGLPILQHFRQNGQLDPIEEYYPETPGDMYPEVEQESIRRSREAFAAQGGFSYDMAYLEQAYIEGRLMPKGTIPEEAPNNFTEQARHENGMADRFEQTHADLPGLQEARNAILNWDEALVTRGYAVFTDGNDLGKLTDQLRGIRAYDGYPTPSDATIKLFVGLDRETYDDADRQAEFERQLQEQLNTLEDPQQVLQVVVMPNVDGLDQYIEDRAVNSEAHRVQKPIRFIRSIGRVFEGTGHGGVDGGGDSGERNDGGGERQQPAPDTNDTPDVQSAPDTPTVTADAQPTNQPVEAIPNYEQLAGPIRNNIRGTLLANEHTVREQRGGGNRPLGYLCQDVRRDWRDIFEESGRGREALAGLYSFLMVDTQEFANDDRKLRLDRNAYDRMEEPLRIAINEVLNLNTLPPEELRNRILGSDATEEQRQAVNPTALQGLLRRLYNNLSNIHRQLYETQEGEGSGTSNPDNSAPTGPTVSDQANNPDAPRQNTDVFDVPPTEPIVVSEPVVQRLVPDDPATEPGTTAPEGISTTPDRPVEDLDQVVAERWGELLLIDDANEVWRRLTNAEDLERYLALDAKAEGVSLEDHYAALIGTFRTAGQGVPNEYQHRVAAITGVLQSMELTGDKPKDALSVAVRLISMENPLQNRW